MASSRPSAPPASQSVESLEAQDAEFNFLYGLQANANIETKRIFFCYIYALYYEQSSWRDETLGECFQEDFEKFTLEDFKAIDALQRRNMRTLLRQRGVYVPTGQGIRVATVLYNLLSELPPWPTQATTPSVPQEDHVHPQPSQPDPEASTVTENNQRETHPQGSAIRTVHNQPIPQNSYRPSKSSNHALQGLFKAYTDDKNKYGGAPTENLSRKTALFLEHCEQNDLSAIQQSRAFSIMLRGHALQYYLDNLKGKSLNIEDLFTAVRKRFEPEERSRAMLREWDELSLPLVIRQNPNKSKTDCLNILVSRLSDIQTSLPTEYHSEIIFKNKLLNSVKDLDECKLAYQKPATSIHGVISDIHSSSATSANTAASSSNDNSHLFYAERKIHRPRSFPRQFNNNSTRSNKRCNVCFRFGCWSTNHSKAERYRAYKRNSNIRQFIAEIDDDDPNDDVMSNGLEELITHIQMNDFDSPNPNETDSAQDPSNKTLHSTNLFLHIAQTDDDDPASSFIAYTTTNATAYALLGSPPVHNRTFHGILVDSGAAFSSSGNELIYNEYCRLMGTTPSIDTSQSRIIRYGIGKELSKGTARIDFPIGNLWMTFHIHIVHADIPIILGIQDMDRLGLYFNNLSNQLIHPESGFYVPTVHFRGHAYVKWDPHLQSHFTTAELHKLHRRFGHPSADKLSNFLRRTGLHDTPGHTRTTLETISRQCDPFQRYSQAPTRFKFKLKDNFYFNHVIYADVFYIEKKPILHVVDEATYYQAATWLPSMKATDLWNALRNCCIDVYVGPPDIIKHDAGKNFIAKAFQSQAQLLNIQTSEVPVEASNAMSVVERYHAPIRRSYNIIKRESPDSSDADALQMAVKSVNDSVGPHGLVPTLLVYGTLPRLGLPFDQPHPSIYKRANAVRKATEELSKRYTRRHVTAALSSQHAPNVQAIYETCLGQPVLVYRTNLKAWTGPFRLLDISGETTTVQMPNGKSKFRTTHVKPYNVEEIGFDSTTPIMDDVSCKDAIHFCYQMTTTSDDSLEAPFQQSLIKEFNNLMERGVFLIVPRKNAKGYRIYGARFVDEIKKVGTPDAYEKSRFVVQAFADKGDNFMTYSPTVQRVSQRILLCLAPCDQDLIMILRDITQAYTQSSKKSIRKIFIEPPDSLNIGHDQLLQVVRPLYGLPESGLFWFETYHSHHVHNLSMTPAVHDMCFLFIPDLFSSAQVRGTTCLQTDDTLNIGTTKFIQMEESKGRRFQRKPIVKFEEGGTLEFNGANICLQNGVYSISQDFHITQLEELPSAKADVHKASFVSQRARGAYIASLSRPDLTAGFAILAQRQNPTKDDVVELNKLIKKAKSRSVRYNFCKLDTKCLRLAVFTDASFAKNQDLSSQLGYVIDLADDHGNANFLHYSSSKSQRVERSALAAELFALSHALDMASTIRVSMNKLLGTNLPLKFYTDSKSLFDATIGINVPTEKRLLIDLAVLRQSYERREISEIVWIPTDANPADTLTKLASKNDHLLYEIMEQNKLRIKDSYWVERKSAKEISFSDQLVAEVQSLRESCD